LKDITFTQLGDDLFGGVTFPWHCNIPLPFDPVS